MVKDRGGSRGSGAWLRTEVGLEALPHSYPTPSC